jgi:hypothetical protein
MSSVPSTTAKVGIPDISVPTTTAAPRRVPSFGKVFSWIIFIIGFLYFFLPLLGTFFHSIKTRPDIFLAYCQILADPKFYGGLVTVHDRRDHDHRQPAIIVPTAYWVRLKVPGCGRWSVRDADAVRPAAGRHGVRPDPRLQQQAARPDRDEPVPASRVRVRGAVVPACTGRSTPASRPPISGA